MADAESIINDLQNFAVDQAANAYAFTQLTFNYADRLLADINIDDGVLNTGLGLDGFSAPSDISASGVAVRRGSSTIYAQDLPDTSGIGYYGPESPPEFTSSVPVPVFNGSVPNPAYAADRMQIKYDSASPDIRAKIDARVSAWAAVYCPGYADGLLYLETQINRVLGGGTALPDAVEQAIYNRQRQRVEAESRGAQRTAARRIRAAGFEVGVLPMNAAMNQVAQEAADRAAAEATSVAVERAKIELQNLQFFAGLSAQLRQAMTQAFLSAAGIYAEAEKAAQAWGDSVGRAALGDVDAATRIFGSEVQRYSTEWGGRATEANIYQSMVGAFAQAVGAAKSRTEAAVQRAQLDMDKAKTRLSASVQAREIDLREDSIQTGLWQAETQAKLSAQDSLARRGGLLLDQSKTAYEGALKARTEEAALRVNANSSAANIASGVSTAMSHMFSAATSPLNGISLKSDINYV